MSSLLLVPPLTLFVPKLPLGEIAYGGAAISIRLGDVASRMLEKAKASRPEGKVSFHLRTSAQLSGLTDRITRKDIYEGACRQNYRKVSPTAAVSLAIYFQSISQQLRMKYLGEKDLLIGMNPLPSGNGEPRIFFICARPPEKVTLHGHYGDADRQWERDTLWAFIA